MSRADIIARAAGRKGRDLTQAEIDFIDRRLPGRTSFVDVRDPWPAIAWHARVDQLLERLVGTGGASGFGPAGGALQPQVAPFDSPSGAPFRPSAAENEPVTGPAAASNPISEEKTHP